MVDLLSLRCMHHVFYFVTEVLFLTLSYSFCVIPNGLRNAGNPLRNEEFLHLWDNLDRFTFESIINVICFSLLVLKDSYYP